MNVGSQNCDPVGSHICNSWVSLLGRNRVSDVRPLGRTLGLTRNHPKEETSRSLYLTKANLEQAKTRLIDGFQRGRFAPRSGVTVA